MKIQFRIDDTADWSEPIEIRPETREYDGVLLDSTDTLIETAAHAWMRGELMFGKASIQARIDGCRERVLNPYTWYGSARIVVGL